MVEGGQLVVSLDDGSTTGLKDASQFVGYQGKPPRLRRCCCKHNGLHLDIQINRATPIGQSMPQACPTLVLEAALSTILDLEDSVAAVDAEDKVLGYSNWLGIIQAR